MEYGYAVGNVCLHKPFRAKMDRFLYDYSEVNKTNESLGIPMLEDLPRSTVQEEARENSDYRLMKGSRRIQRYQFYSMSLFKLRLIEIWYLCMLDLAIHVIHNMWNKELHIDGRRSA